MTYGVSPFTISATSNSGLAVSFASTHACRLHGAGITVTIVGGGTCSIVASQAGNATYAAAATVMQSFTVNPASQIITFGPLSSPVMGTAPFPLSPTAQFRVAVTLASNKTAICTVSGVTVTLIARGYLFDHRQPTRQFELCGGNSGHRDLHGILHRPPGHRVPLAERGGGDVGHVQGSLFGSQRRGRSERQCCCR